jgi:hypothetical protein
MGVSFVSFTKCTPRLRCLEYPSQKSLKYPYKDWSRGYLTHLARTLKKEPLLLRPFFLCGDEQCLGALREGFEARLSIIYEVRNKLSNRGTDPVRVEYPSVSHLAFKSK